MNYSKIISKDNKKGKIRKENVVTNKNYRKKKEDDTKKGDKKNDDYDNNKKKKDNVDKMGTITITAKQIMTSRVK